MSIQTFYSVAFSIIILTCISIDCHCNDIRLLTQQEMNTLKGGACDYCDDYSWLTKGATVCSTNGYDIIYDALCHPIGGADCEEGAIEYCAGCVHLEVYSGGSGGASATVRSFCWAGTLYDWHCSGGTLTYTGYARYNCK